MSSISTPTTTARKTSRRIVAAAVAGGVAVGGLATAIVLGLGGSAATAHIPASSHSSHAAASAATTGSHTAHHHGSHDVVPSQSVKLLQQQLAQLNYYDGPISGYWNSDTTHAIEYLQRSADLPETGVLTTATQQALAYQLAHGDNQMGGNTNTPASPAVAKLQSELGQLNYYDGSITGHVNTGTIHAIEYLQRAAGLPQTGSMNAATQQALAYQLVHGDNQMGS